jgi:N-carbamoylputrescine amidase
MRVAVAQIESALADVDANVEKHLDCIARARREKAGMLLFPELSLTGHSAGPSTLDVAMKRDDPRIKMLCEASGDMLTTFGLIEEGPAAQFYNSCYTISAAGLRHIHRKVNLATYGKLDEGQHFAGGRYVEAFDATPDWRCATLICNDYWNPALIYLAMLHGATMLLSPVSSALEAVGGDFDNPANWTRAIGFYSSVYGLPIVFANRVGQEGGLRFWGGSRIVDAHGEDIVRAGEGETMIVGEIAFEAVRQARYRLPSVRDSNLALIAREIRRLEQILDVPDVVRDRKT